MPVPVLLPVALYERLEVAGVSNALSKSLGSANKINTAYATLEALKEMTPADKWITRSGDKAPKKSSAKPKADKAKTEAK